jgi:hypothetical protein
VCTGVLCFVIMLNVLVCVFVHFLALAVNAVKLSSLLWVGLVGWESCATQGICRTGVCLWGCGVCGDGAFVLLMVVLACVYLRHGFAALVRRCGA